MAAEASPQSRTNAGNVLFRVERFEYALADLVVRLSVRLAFEVPTAVDARLLVVCDSAGAAFPPLLTNCRPASGPGAHEWLWRAAFSVPSDVMRDPSAQFTAELADDLVLRLPAPSVTDAIVAAASTASKNEGHGWSRAVRRGGLLLVVTCQLCLVPAWLTGALADSPARSASLRYSQASIGGAEGSTGGQEPAPTQTLSTPSSTTETPPPATETTASEPPPAPTIGTPSPGGPTETTTSGPEAPAPTPTPPAASATTPAAQAPQAPTGAHGPSSRGAGAERTETIRVLQDTSSGPRAARRSAHHAGQAGATKPHTASHVPAPAPEAAMADVLSAPGVAEEVPPILMELRSGLTAFGEIDPPAFLLPIYKAADERYDVPWRVLAAINEVETNYGHNLSVSSAGAVGWMQFMPETWRQWAVDADHDGALNPYSPWDAIFTAARYLAASGASSDLPGAIFAYNHASWYVTEVLVRAHMLENNEAFAPLQKGYSLPLDARYMRRLGRTDDGVDIETAPDGALVYSIAPGIVSAVASNPGGFGPDYPVVEATAGALTGQYIYYGHVAASLVQPGQKVAAGQPIAIIGHTGDAVNLRHGHIEIGFSDGGGDPLNHHGSNAATPAGDVMRSVLVSLSDEFRVHNE
jgi:murein DD-endopeptidase MepM/ murein hydrolase activator NlpD